jgi:hypothetical protein
VYVPHRNLAKLAGQEICKEIQEIEISHPDAFIVVDGDFNHCSLNKCGIQYYQHVKCATRGHATLDLCYTNVKAAYRSFPIHNLGQSDHNLVLLEPSYRPIVQRQKPQIITVQQWTTEGLENLQASLDMTDWNVFITACSNIDELTVTVSDYINFCSDTSIPTKRVKCFPNNKPWITPDIKTLLNKKKQLFGQNNKDQLRALQKQIDVAIHHQKLTYKQKIESHFTENNMNKVWHGMRLMSGYSNGSSKSCPLPKTSFDFANELNSFYNRFDCYDFSKETSELIVSLTSAPMDGQPFLIVSEEEVRKEFSRLNPMKAAGPDGVTPRVLKLCCSQLASIFTFIFNWSFELSYVPQLWKLSCIIPIPKKANITCNNDLRPVALTSVVMKSAERFVLRHLKAMTSQFTDPLQFAYRAKRSTGDAILFMLERLYSHLEKSYCGHYARIMYFDFSSAFNTIQPVILARKLIDMDVPNDFIVWIINYLTDRSQYVYIRPSNCRSLIIKSNTGAPQGTVLAPFLFTSYTADIRADDEKCSLVKFADDTALIGLLVNDDIAAYLEQIQTFVKYCKDNYLELNVKKTQELIIDYRRKVSIHAPVTINDNEVQQTKNYKYLGLVIDDQLNWHSHFDHLYRKLNSRLFCLRKMSKFKVDAKVLQLFYNAVIASVWSYCLCAWGGNAKSSDITRITSTIKQASRLIGEPQRSFDESYQDVLRKKFTKVHQDDSHPLHNIFADASSERSGRMRLPFAKTNRHRLSFVPQAMRLFNFDLRR